MTEMTMTMTCRFVDHMFEQVVIRPEKLDDETKDACGITRTKDEEWSTNITWIKDEV
jgi:hypothetical protein